MLAIVPNTSTSTVSQLSLCWDSNSMQVNGLFSRKAGMYFHVHRKRYHYNYSRNYSPVVGSSCGVSVQADYTERVVPPDHRNSVSTFHCCHWQSCLSWHHTRKLTTHSFTWYDCHLMRLSNFKNKESQEITKILVFWILFCSHYFWLLWEKNKRRQWKADIDSTFHMFWIKFKSHHYSTIKNIIVSALRIKL